MGMYVVAKLAHRHGLDVELIRGVPGITVKVTIPRDHLEITRVEPDYDVIDLTQPEMIEHCRPRPRPPEPVAGGAGACRRGRKRETCRCASRVEPSARRSRHPSCRSGRRHDQVVARRLRTGASGRRRGAAGPESDD